VGATWIPHPHRRQRRPAGRSPLPRRQPLQHDRFGRCRPEWGRAGFLQGCGGAFRPGQWGGTRGGVPASRAAAERAPDRSGSGELPVPSRRWSRTATATGVLRRRSLPAMPCWDA